jgi:hypothetical protein
VFTTKHKPSQVLPVLDNLESDYQQQRDWCARYTAIQQRNSTASIKSTESNGSGATPASKLQFMSDELSKHMDHKAKFLRACTHALKQSELFLKYVRRTEPQAPQVGIHNCIHKCHFFQSAATIEAQTLKTLDELRTRETHILLLWTAKKKQLDQCQQFVLLEESAKHVRIEYFE